MIQVFNGILFHFNKDSIDLAVELFAIAYIIWQKNVNFENITQQRLLIIKTVSLQIMKFL